MSNKDFFRIIVKVLSLLIIVIGVIPTSLNLFFWFKDDLSSGFSLLGYLFISLALVYLMLLKTDFIISFLKLDSGFDSEKLFNDNIKDLDKKIIQLSCLIMGVYVLVNSLPLIVIELLKYFKNNINSYNAGVFDLDSNYSIYYNFFYFLSGILLIALRRKISHFFTT